jgi:hypothetical protein
VPQHEGDADLAFWPTCRCADSASDDITYASFNSLSGFCEDDEALQRRYAVALLALVGASGFARRSRHYKLILWCDKLINSRLKAGHRGGGCRAEGVGCCGGMEGTKMLNV